MISQTLVSIVGLALIAITTSAIVCTSTLSTALTYPTYAGVLVVSTESQQQAIWLLLCGFIASPVRCRGTHPFHFRLRPLLYHWPSGCRWHIRCVAVCLLSLAFTGEMHRCLHAHRGFLLDQEQHSRLVDLDVLHRLPHVQLREFHVQRVPRCAPFFIALRNTSSFL